MEPLTYNYDIQSFWCHHCKTEFSKSKAIGILPQIECSNCKSDFCEEISTNTQNDPREYVPFTNLTTNNETQQQIAQTRNISFNGNTLLLEISRRLLLESLISHSLSASSLLDRYIDQLIYRILLTERPKNGNPPASKSAIENLPKIQKNEIDKNCSECSICRDDFKETDYINQMPCKHSFHNMCLEPWLKERNSCPICRFELPTDNEEYENQKHNRSTN